MVINVLGCSYKTASLHTLEAVSSSEKEIKEYILSIMGNEQINECLIISTCNRFEIYTVSAEGSDPAPFLFDFLGKVKNRDFTGEQDQWYRLTGEKGVNHLFSVIAGLDSMILGEPQIAGQVKRAYSIANHTGSNGPVLHKLFHRAFRVSKRIKNETAVNRGAGSAGFAAIELAAAMFTSLNDLSVLLIGAGEIARAAAKNLFERNIKHFYITNRTREKAEEIAAELQGCSIPFETFETYINKADIIISTTGSKEYIITGEKMQSLLEKRGERKLLIVDIAMPRDFDPAIGELPGVHLVNIQGLKEIVHENIKSRQEEVPRAMAVIDQERESFFKWKNRLPLHPVIKSLSEKVESARTAEIEKLKKRLEPGQVEEIDRITAIICSKLIAGPIKRIKELDEAAPHIETIKDLFDLQHTKEQ